MASKVIRTTPGVYVTELDAFPRSIPGVATAVPAFIGYTQQATLSGKPMYFKPMLINSLADFEAIFGVGYLPTYKVTVVTSTNPEDYDFSQGANNYALTPTSATQYNLYNSLRMFYANGGGAAYVVSVGDYTKTISKDDLEQGLNVIADQTGPTMLVIPDAVLLPAATDEPLKSPDFYTISKEMLAQCKKLGDRVAIFDVFAGNSLKQMRTGFQAELTTRMDVFREGIGNENLNYGMTYFPFLNSTIVQPSEISYTNLDIGEKEQLALIQSILKAQAATLYTEPALTTVNGYIDAIGDTTISDDPAARNRLNQNLTKAVPLLQQIENLIAQKNNILPPSGTMAGIFSRNDATRGVWNAPANMDVNSVIGPTVNINNDQQSEMNVPLDGKAVNAIRTFVGRGTLVWGARTLDGNSNDWRYIQVRRTLIYIEQSIKAALNSFVFAANDGQTWVAVTSMISNFLQGLWSQGGLMGDKASDAFSVSCGLGSTMTPQDILEGYMVVQITLQMIHPAEFIELTFKQKMGS